VRDQRPYHLVGAEEGQELLDVGQLQNRVRE
jgi:hypothetical protein